jgi:hypothetical protein
VQGSVRSVGDEADGECTVKVTDRRKRIESVRPLGAVAGKLIFAAKVIDGRKGTEGVRLLNAVAGKLIFAAASGFVHMILDAASEHFRIRMVNQIVNMKLRIVSAAAGALSCQRIQRLLSVATKLGPSIGPQRAIV